MNAQDYTHAVANLAKGVPDRDAYMVESDVRGPGGRRVGSLDRFCRQILIALNEDHSKTRLNKTKRFELGREEDRTSVLQPVVK